MIHNKNHSRKILNNFNPVAVMIVKILNLLILYFKKFVRTWIKMNIINSINNLLKLKLIEYIHKILNKRII